MRMRRLEMAVLAITLAFAFFMGGFFTGRSRSPVNISAAAKLTDGTPGIQVSVTGDIQSDITGTPPGQPDDTASVPGEGTDNPQRIPTVQSNETPAQGTGSVKASDGKININTATKGELTDLSGIGDVLASRIIDYRQQNGNFTKIEDIRNVSGIGERRFEAIKDFITVG